MRQAETMQELDERFRDEIIKLAKEYDYQRLRPQTFADYCVSNVDVWEHCRDELRRK